MLVGLVGLAVTAAWGVDGRLVAIGTRLEEPIERIVPFLRRPRLGARD